MTVVTTVSYGFDPETEWDLIERFREMAKEEGGWKERTVYHCVVFERTTFRKMKFGKKRE